MTGIHVAEDVCFPTRHRQVVVTIPKRLRIHARFDRKLLGKLSSCAWNCIKSEVRRMLDLPVVVPGVIGAIQTFGQLLHHFVRSESQHPQERPGLPTFYGGQGRHGKSEALAKLLNP